MNNISYKVWLNEYVSKLPEERKKIIKEFSNFMLLERNSYNTMKAYINDVNKFLDYMNIKPIEVTTMDIASYSMELEEVVVHSKTEKNKRMSGKTINRKLYAIYKYINFLNEQYNTNITVNMKRIKVKTTDIGYGVNLLTKSEYKRILTAAKDDNNIMFATILQTMFLTGMRISEVLRLTIYDIDKKSFNVLRGKGRKDRTIPIPEELRVCFKEYMQVRKNRNEDEITLFLNTRGNPMTEWSCDYYIKKYARKVKVSLKKARCHNVRHLFGYILLNEKRKSITFVALLMGHSNINTTKLYLNETEKELIQDMQDYKLD